MNIGDKVFSINRKEKKVYECEVVGFHISGGKDPGYLMVSLLRKKDNENIFLESKLVFSNKKDAESYLKEKTPALEKADKKIKEIALVVNDLRKEVIGEPMFLDLAKRIMGGPISGK
jgi:hypothetical protein